MPRTLCTIVPYWIECAPELLLAVIPPIVARSAVEGSIGKNSPCSRNCALSCESTIPGRTRAVCAATSTDTRSRRYLLSR